MASAFEDVVDAIRIEFADDSVEWHVGAQAARAQGSKRRVIWRWVGGSMTKPPAGHIDVNGLRILPLWLNEATIQVACLGETLEDTQDIWAKVFAATNDVAGGASVPGSYRVPTQDERAALSLGDNNAIVQAFVWKFIVGKVGGQLVTVTTVSHTCTIDYSL